MKNNELEVKDIKIDTLEIIKKDLENAIKERMKEDAIAQKFNVHIGDDQTFSDKNLEPYDLYFVFSRNKVASIYDNDVIPYTLYAFVNNSLIDSAREILNTLCDVARGYEKKNYVTYVDTNGNIKTVLESKYNLEKLNGGVDIAISPMFSQFTETFDKPSVLNNNIPAGTVYFCYLFMSMTIIFNKNINSLDIEKLYYLYDNGNNVISQLDINVIQATLTFSIEHDTQPFYFKNNDISLPYIKKEIALANTDLYPNIDTSMGDNTTQISDLTESVAKYGITTLTLIIPFKNNLFTQNIIKIIGENKRYSATSVTINNDFYFNLIFLNGLVMLNNKFKLKEFTYGKAPGEADVIQLSFTN